MKTVHFKNFMFLRTRLVSTVKTLRVNPLRGLKHFGRIYLFTHYPYDQPQGCHSIQLLSLLFPPSIHLPQFLSSCTFPAVPFCLFICSPMRGSVFKHDDDDDGDGCGAAC